MKIPVHIAIIMDGNGRWARTKGRPRIEGHRAGINTVREIVKACSQIGVKYLTLYSFSVDNWKRPSREVAALMRLLQFFLRREIKMLNENNVRLTAIGRLIDLPLGVRKELNYVSEKTAKNTGLNLNLALSYGGRTEIIEAIRRIGQDLKNNNIKIEEIDEKSFSNYLYTKNIPDPELLIRTSGELRVSNFLLWQISYSEIWVTKTLWPDFDKKELLEAIEDFSKRQRRFGGLN